MIIQSESRKLNLQPSGHNLLQKY